MAYIDDTYLPALKSPPKPYKIVLSIDVDESLGHIMRESYGDRLLVDKEQARRLAAVLLDYAGEPTPTQLGMPAEKALIKLSEQLKSFMGNNHCNEQTPLTEDKL